MTHASPSDLALLAGGDLPLWRRIGAGFHVRGCEECNRALIRCRAGRERLRAAASELPEGLNWDRLAGEMTANIRVGLAAGECVAPRRRSPAKLSWKPVAAMAGLAVLMAGSWWLNVPAAQQESLGRSLRAIWTGQPAALELGPMLEVTSAGVELKQNGGSMAVSRAGSRPLSVSVSMQGAARARYVDDTGQITITSVYAQ